jgi:aminoacrylate hydrolase
MPRAAGLWYEWHGPEDGEVLILSAGLGGSGTYWAPNLPAFAERYRVLLYDHRGTGRSEPLPPGPTSVEAMAQDVMMLMEALGIRYPHFVGHALGGLIGLELSTFPSAVAKLVVINCCAGAAPKPTSRRSRSSSTLLAGARRIPKRWMWRSAGNWLTSRR